MFKSKKRSASGTASTQSYTSTRPCTAVIGTVGEDMAKAFDSVIISQPDAGAVHEPLVLDYAAMHDGHDTKHHSPPLTPPPSQKAGHNQDSWLSDDDAVSAPAPPDFTRRGIHVPLRTSSNTPAANKRRISLQRRLSSGPSGPSSTTTTTTIMPITPEHHQSQTRNSSRTMLSSTPSTVAREPSRGRSPKPQTLRSSADSVISYDQSAPSFATQDLAPLQQRGNIDNGDRLSPLLEDDPRSWDLLAPAEPEHKQYSLESQSELLFSKEHLQAIFKDTSSLLRFTQFLSAARPKSVPTLIYYLDALKALRAIHYANAVAEALEPIDGLEFTETQARPTINAILEEKANRAFDVLVRDDLPAFITHIFTQLVSVSINKRITGNLPPMLRDASEGLAEVFCLSDPSRTDNPIIFASEEFHRTTQYGVSYAIGRNCRFLQGPKTNRNSVARLREMIIAGKETSEVFLNYRRDGSPFMNLLMMAPLLDSRGNIRYFIGAQIDVSGLVRDGTDLPAFQRMGGMQEDDDAEEQKDEFRELSEMFNHAELDIVRKHGGNMHREQIEARDDASIMQARPRVLIQDQSMLDMHQAERPAPRAEGRLSGPYKHYLLVRPAPSLRILFTSPSLRVPGILQSHFLERIGGSHRVRDAVGAALADGSRGVTAKIRWLSHAVHDLDASYDEGRPRWIHCTPLLGSAGTVGVWMVVLVDEEKYTNPVRKFRQAPPVAHDVRGRKEGARQQQAMLDDFDAMDFDPAASYCPPRTSSSLRSEDAHHGLPATARHIAVDTLRGPSGSAMHDQRALRSASSSVWNYVLGGSGGNKSTESFHI